MQPIALYYPYIHVRDDTWLKYAALYWPKMGRLRPQGYRTTDSPVARALQQELDWIVDIEPGVAAELAKQPFVELLSERAAGLRERFSLEHVDGWSARPLPGFSNVSQIGGATSAGPTGPSPDRSDPLDPRLGYVHVSKLHDDVLQSLVSAGLAARVRGRGGWWLGMHPELTNVYTCALVEQVAAINKLHPITDQVLPHTAVSGWTVERLAEVLLREDWTDRADPGGKDVLAPYLLAAFEMVVPKGLEHVPVDKILEIRQEFGAELESFREYVTAEVERISEIEEVRDIAVFQEHLRTEVQASVARRLGELRERMRSVGLESATALANIKSFSLPPLAATAASMAGVDPLLTGPAAIATCLGAAYSSYRRQRRDVVRDSPVGYLLRVGDAVSPSSLTERVQAAMRTAWPR